MVSDVIDELKDLAARLEAYGRREPLLRLRTGELVTHAELTRRADEQRRAAARQAFGGCHPMVMVIDECQALDPVF